MSSSRSSFPFFFLIIFFLIPVSAVSQEAIQEKETKEYSANIINRVTISKDLPRTSHAEPHLSINPNNPNELLLASIVLPDSAMHHVDAFTSKNLGKTWTRENLPTVDSLGTIDPWTSFDRNGNSFVSLLTGTTFVENHWFKSFKLFRKVDGEPDWEKTYTHVLQRGNGGSFDQPKLTVDQSINSEFTNRLYISSNRWARRTKLNNGTKTIAFLYSKDTGNTFSEMKYVAENNFRKQSLNTRVLSDGTIIGGFYNYMTAEPRPMSMKPVWTFKSFDGGETISYPNFITNKAVGMPLLAADTTSNGFKDRIYMVGALSDDNPTLSALYSDSRGERWSVPQKIKGLPEERKVAHYVAVDGEGRLGVLWNTLSHDGEKQKCYNVNFSYSTDGGKSFTTKNMLKKDSYCLEIPGKPRMYAMSREYRPINPRFSRGGEYMGLVGLPEGGFYAVWVQTVNGILHLKGSQISF